MSVMQGLGAVIWGTGDQVGRRPWACQLVSGIRGKGSYGINAFSLDIP